MIRGLSPIPRGGGKPEGKEGDCIPTLGAVSLIESAWVRPHSFGAFLHPEIQQPPPAGSPKNHSPRRGPTILGGTFGARVRATSQRANSGRAAAYFVSPARHSPGRRLLRLHAQNKRPSGIRTLRISKCVFRRVNSVFEKECARSSTLRIIFVQVQARYSVFEKCGTGIGTPKKSACRV